MGREEATGACEGLVTPTRTRNPGPDANARRAPARERDPEVFPPLHHCAAHTASCLRFPAREVCFLDSNPMLGVGMVKSRFCKSARQHLPLRMATAPCIGNMNPVSFRQFPRVFGCWPTLLFTPRGLVYRRVPGGMTGARCRRLLMIYLAQ